MKFELKNCNNIDNGEIEITESILNIKFGINGTGKSTIAKAIQYSIETPDKLNELTPFKLRGTETDETPTVNKPAEINSILVFNEDYLNQILFKEDELIANSFEILIQTPSYIESTEKIKDYLKEVTDVFADNEELDQAITDFESLLKNFKSTKTNLSKTSSVYRGLKDGNKLEHIPIELSGYTPFIKSDDCTNWLDWQMKGEKFIDISDSCPYCTSSTEKIKETIKSVSKTYDKNVIKNFVGIIDAISNLGEYFAPDTKTLLIKITKVKEGLKDEELEYLFAIHNQITNYLSNLTKLKYISPNTFQEEGVDIEAMINGLKIDLAFFSHFQSEKSQTIVDSINVSLETVIEKIGQLKGEVNKQKAQTKVLIKKHKKDIDTFLKTAGYKYEVEIDDSDTENYKLKLRHIESEEKIVRGNQHLSFGERNAFALVLFMYEVLSKNPDLIILDDPISSFDKNKKYAILHMLFRGENCLKMKNVLMLTHDFDPVIDTVKVLKEFNQLSESKFLSTKNGLLEEKLIEKKDILTFPQICDKILEDNEIDILIKLIYLRRKTEIIDDTLNEYQVLSNLFHNRKIDELKDFRLPPEDDSMNVDDFTAGIESIKNVIHTFDYELLLARLSDVDDLKSLYSSNQNGYVKLQLFRLIYNDSLKDVNSVLRKFINETFHIENELISQLDPTEFEIVPDSIINDCDLYLIEN